MSTCTAPKKGHLTPQAAANCPVHAASNRRATDIAVLSPSPVSQVALRSPMPGVMEEPVDLGVDTIDGEAHWVGYDDVVYRSERRTWACKVVGTDDLYYVVRKTFGAMHIGDHDVWDVGVHCEWSLQHGTDASALNEGDPRVITNDCDSDLWEYSYDGAAEALDRASEAAHERWTEGDLMFDEELGQGISDNVEAGLPKAVFCARLESMGVAPDNDAAIAYAMSNSDDLLQPPDKATVDLALEMHRNRS